MRGDPRRVPEPTKARAPLVPAPVPSPATPPTPRRSPESSPVRRAAPAPAQTPRDTSVHSEWYSARSSVHASTCTSSSRSATAARPGYSPSPGREAADASPQSLQSERSVRSPVHYHVRSPHTELNTSSSPATGVTVIEGPLSSPRSVRSREKTYVQSPTASIAVTVHQLAPQSPSISSGSNSTPHTGITYIEPDFSNLSISQPSSPTPDARAGLRSGASSSTRRARRATYVDAEVQATTPPRAYTYSTPCGTPPPSPSSSSRPITRTHSEGHSAYCECPVSRMCVSCRRPLSSASQPMTATASVVSPAGSQATLSPLGLGLTQPMHAPNRVYSAAADPRSPIHRTASVPAR